MRKILKTSIEDVPMSIEIAQRSSRIISFDVEVIYEVRVSKWDEEGMIPEIILAPVVHFIPVVLKDRFNTNPDPVTKAERQYLNFPKITRAQIEKMGIKLP